MNKAANFLDGFLTQLSEHQKIFDVVSQDEKLLKACAAAAELMVAAVKVNKTIFFCGNGGSAADAQHAAAELVGRYLVERRAISAESLCVDPSILTALGNDYGFEFIFSRQLEARGKVGDVFFGISTSGGSKNIVRALEMARRKNLQRILLTSEKVSQEVEELCDVVLSVPAKFTPRIQEVHIFIIHLICGWIEKSIIPDGS